MKTAEQRIRELVKRNHHRECPKCGVDLDEHIIDVSCPVTDADRISDLERRVTNLEMRATGRA